MGDLKNYSKPVRVTVADLLFVSFCFLVLSLVGAYLIAYALGRQPSEHRYVEYAEGTFTEIALGSKVRKLSTELFKLDLDVKYLTQELENTKFRNSAHIWNLYDITLFLGEIQNVRKEIYLRLVNTVSQLIDSYSE